MGWRNISHIAIIFWPQGSKFVALWPQRREFTACVHNLAVTSDPVMTVCDVLLERRLLGKRGLTHAAAVGVVNELVGEEQRAVVKQVATHLALEEGVVGVAAALRLLALRRRQTLLDVDAEVKAT